MREEGNSRWPLIPARIRGELDDQNEMGSRSNGTHGAMAKKIEVVGGYLNIDASRTAEFQNFCIRLGEPLMIDDGARIRTSDKS